MFNIKSIVKYTKNFENESLHSEIIMNHMKIEAWFRNQWVKYPAPFYSSIDIRNSGYKIAPVDTNLFPAGFNNLDESFGFLYISAAQHAFERLSPNITKILIISENHTRNKYYQSNIDALSNILTKSGYQVKVAALLNIETGEGLNPLLSQDENSLKYDGFKPDADPFDEFAALYNAPADSEYTKRKKRKKRK